MTLILVLCFFGSTLYAQDKPDTFSSYIDRKITNDKEKIIIKDEQNGFARIKVWLATASEEPTLEGYQEYGIWNTAKGKKLMGYTQTNLAFHTYTGKVEKPAFERITAYNQEVMLDFFYLNEDVIIDDVYDKEAVKKAYQTALDKIQARGAEGSETIYAEMPRKGTSIALYVVYGSELLNPKNQGLPQWKLKFGELVFNKTTGKFTLKTL